jgi:hypothetical protein
MEKARNLKIEIKPTDTPDAIPQKNLTLELPSNAEEALQQVIFMIIFF